MSGIRPWVRALERTRSFAHLTLPGLIEQLAETHGERLALLDQRESLTYRALADRMHCYARWATSQGVAGQTVALLMHNSADYVAIWLGLTRVGCKVALLNTNLHKDGLVHIIGVCSATHLIASAPVEEHVPMQQTHIWPLDLTATPDCHLPPCPTPQDIALLISTSGTTGLPKAVNITHRRITEWGLWFSGLMDVKPDDRLYDCLPMYHSTGGIVAVGSMLVSGGSVVIRQRFSASRFWGDVVESECTIFQYIGELCRYLTSCPPDAMERQHRLRLAVGNGMQADVWHKLQDRFCIPHILEFYAATEGVISLYNIDGEPGAIGWIPPVLALHFGIRLIRVDLETGEPVLGPSGFCIVCDSDEPGEAIGLLTEGRVFDGYNDQRASARKIIKNAFAPGDRWFRSGDLMRKNSAGYYFFVDRLGDTFRWKGENVSTTEVANVIRSCPGVIDAVVYGVHVHGNEGKAGMTAVLINEGFDLVKLSAHVRQGLPAYARPMFVRVCATLDMTATFKLTKNRLAAEGYLCASDPVWVYEQGGEDYVPYNHGSV